MLRCNRDTPILTVLLKVKILYKITYVRLTCLFCGSMKYSDIISNIRSRALVRDIFDGGGPGGTIALSLEHQFDRKPQLKDYCIDAVLAICEFLEQRNIYIGSPATKDENIKKVSRTAFRFPGHLLLLNAYGVADDYHYDDLIRSDPSPDDTRRYVAWKEKDILQHLRLGGVTQSAASEIDRLVADLGEKEAAIRERERLERKEQDRLVAQKRREAAKELRALEPKRPRRVHPKGTKKAARPAPSEGV